jgi:Xaa-Pro aminopeptidase
MSNAAKRIADIQRALQKERIGGWLFYDFRHSDPIAYRVLGLSAGGIATRRWFYFVPAEGEPVRLVHQIERAKLDALPGRSIEYAGWEALMAGLRGALRGVKSVAMQYSPMNAIPYLSRVDAGTVEAVRSCGVEVVSSANLVQRFEAVWSPQQWSDHQEAANALRTIVDGAFAAAAEAIRNKTPLTECGLQSWVLAQMEKNGLITDHPPIVAVNAHSADPHFVPSRADDAPINAGDFLLLDLWAKPNRPGSVYADYTWTAFAGRNVPQRYREVFEVVRRGRDAAVQFLEEALADNRDVHGWEVDAMCRREIEGAGYGAYFIHRTGHSIGEEDHGNGANIDNFETHDDRLLIPQTCFSIEPGIYLPREFGVRSEINVYIDEQNRPIVTGLPVQTEIVPLDV